MAADTFTKAFKEKGTWNTLMHLIGIVGSRDMKDFLKVDHMKCQQVVEAKAKEVESESAMVVCGSCSAYDTNHEEKTIDCMLDMPDDQQYTDGPVAASVGLSNNGEDCLNAEGTSHYNANTMQTIKHQSWMQKDTYNTTEQLCESRNDQKYEGLHSGIFAQLRSVVLLALHGRVRIQFLEL